MLDHAYHGNLSSLIAISPYKFNRAGGQGRPDGTWVCELPDPYRGGCGSTSLPGRRYAEDVRRQLDAVEAAGRRRRRSLSRRCRAAPARSCFPTATSRRPSPHARAAGAVCIADEVQAGFGRVGTHTLGLRDPGRRAGHRHAGKADRQRPPARRGSDHAGARPLVRDRDGVLQHLRRQPGLLRGGPGGAGRAARRAAAGPRPRARASGCSPGCASWPAATSWSATCAARACSWAWSWSRDRDTREPATAAASAVVEAAKARGVLLSTDGPRRQRDQDQAAAGARRGGRRPRGRRRCSMPPSVGRSQTTPRQRAIPTVRSCPDAGSSCRRPACLPYPVGRPRLLPPGRYRGPAEARFPPPP